MLDTTQDRVKWKITILQCGLVLVATAWIMMIGFKTDLAGHRDVSNALPHAAFSGSSAQLAYGLYRVSSSA